MKKFKNKNTGEVARVSEENNKFYIVGGNPIPMRFIENSCEGEEAIEEHEKPHFLIRTESAGQHQLARDVTHWMELPDLPTLVK